MTEPGQKISIIKVPASVAKVWQEQTRDAVRNNCQVLLGTLDNAAQGSKRVLELSNCAASDGDKIPKHYKVEETGAAHTVKTFLFSSKKDAGVTLEGETVPLSAHVDSFSDVYKAATATANKEANAEKHFTKHDNSLVFQRQAALNQTAAVTRVQKHAKIGKEAFESRREEIEGELFELFKDKPAWKTADVARLLKLSNAQASQLLTAIAVKVQNGPLRGEWSLKPEYRQDEDMPEQGAVNE